MRRDAHDGLHLRLSPNGGVPLWRVPVEPSSACLLTNKRRRRARSRAASFRRCMVDSNVEVRTVQGRTLSDVYTAPVSEGSVAPYTPKRLSSGALHRGRTSQTG